MDIRDIQPKSPPQPEPSRPVRASTPVPTDKGGRGEAASPDQVTISGKAKAFSAVREAALDVPEVRQEVVDAVRSRLERGTLPPVPEQIARLLIAQGILD